MASTDYLRLIEEAQKKKLKLAKKQEKQIKEIYQNIYLNVSRELDKVNPNSLSETYLESLKNTLEDEIKAIEDKLNKVIKNNMLEASNLGNNPQLDFFMDINSKYELDLGDTFKSMFAEIPKSAMNEILFGKAYKDRAGLSERIWANTKNFTKDINYIIAEGIAAKKSVYDIAKDLEKYVDPSSAKPWDWCKVYPNAAKKIDYNAQRLARTSINHAYQQAQKRSCLKNPYVEGIKWVSANGHRSCNLCKDRHGKIFKIKETPLDHPNGLCTTIPYIPMGLDKIGIELRNWLDGESNPKLDKWFKKYGAEFAGDIPQRGNTKNNTNNNKDEKYLTFTDGKKLNQFFGGEKFKDRKNSMEGIWKKQLSSDEKDAIRWYCGDGYAYINSYLRKYGDWEYIDKNMVEEAIKDLDSSISKFDLKDNISVYRAIEPSAFGGLNADFSKLIGTTYTDNAYMSTSPLLDSTAVNKDLLMQIDVPKGKGIGAYINSISGFKDEEYEFLLAKGTKCEIYDISEIDGKPLIKMKVIENV